jgi:hypothetical protein
MRLLRRDRRALEPTAFEVALVEAIIGTNGETPDRSALLETATFLAEQLDALPSRLQLPYRLGMAVFSAHVFLRHRRRFSELDLPRRHTAVADWAFGPVPLFRQLFRPVRSIALLAYYDR